MSTAVMPEASSLGVLVAGAAVIISAIMQYLTIRSARENARETLRTARENTHDTLATSLATALTTIRGDNLQHVLDELIQDLSSYMANSYFIDTGYRTAMQEHKPWPGEHWDEVKLEDVLYNKIRLRLNPNDPLDAQLLQDLEQLRKTDSASTWITRRDRVVESAQRASDSKWKQILEP